MKLRNFAIASAITASSALTGLFAFGIVIGQTCVPGNAAYEAGTGICVAQNAVTAKEKAIADKQAAEQKLKDEKARAEQVRRAEAYAAKEAAKEKAAQAKFEAEGWFELSNGIYGRWCTDTCSQAEVVGNSSYWLMEVWAKDRAAGDIYAQINIMQNGVVTGWTNDTAFLDKGQRGVLTFQKYGLSNGAAYQAQLTKFNARGSW